MGRRDGALGYYVKAGVAGGPDVLADIAEHLTVELVDDLGARLRGGVATVWWPAATAPFAITDLAARGMPVDPGILEALDANPGGFLVIAGAYADLPRFDVVDGGG